MAKIELQGHQVPSVSSEAGLVLIFLINAVLFKRL